MQNRKIFRDAQGVARFEANPLVKYLLDHSSVDMNHLFVAAALNGWRDEHQAEFAQMIGYSVSGWGDLSYVTRRQAGIADDLAAKLPPA